MERRGRVASQSATGACLPGVRRPEWLLLRSTGARPAHPRLRLRSEGRVPPRGWAMLLGLLFQLQVKPVWGEARRWGGTGRAGGSRIPRVRELHAAGRLFRGSLRTEHRSGQKEAAEEATPQKRGVGGKSLVAAREGSGPPRHFSRRFPACLPVCPRPLHRPSLPAPDAARDLCCDLSRGPASLPGRTRGERPFHVPGRTHSLPSPPAQNFAARTSEGAWWAESLRPFSCRRATGDH